MSDLIFCWKHSGTEVNVHFWIVSWFVPANSVRSCMAILSRPLAVTWQTVELCCVITATLQAVALCLFSFLGLLFWFPFNFVNVFLRREKIPPSRTVCLKYCVRNRSVKQKHKFLPFSVKRDYIHSEVCLWNYFPCLHEKWIYMVFCGWFFLLPFSYLSVCHDGHEMLETYCGLLKLWNFLIIRCF